MDGHVHLDPPSADERAFLDWVEERASYRHPDPGFYEIRDGLAPRLVVALRCEAGDCPRQLVAEADAVLVATAATPEAGGTWTCPGCGHVNSVSPEMLTCIHDQYHFHLENRG